MNAKEFVQIVKKMFSKGLTPEEKIKLADEGPVCRLLLRQWDKFFGTSIYNPQIQISAESGTKRSNFRQKDKTKRSKKGCTQHL